MSEKISDVLTSSAIKLGAVAVGGYTLINVLPGLIDRLVSKVDIPSAPPLPPGLPDISPSGLWHILFPEQAGPPTYPGEMNYAEFIDYVEQKYGPAPEWPTDIVIHPPGELPAVNSTDRVITYDDDTTAYVNAEWIAAQVAAQLESDRLARIAAQQIYPPGTPTPVWIPDEFVPEIWGDL